MINKISIVDDHYLFLKGLLEMIKSYFPSSTIINVYSSPKQYLAESKYDEQLLISDIQMPEMNGIEMIELIKAKNPDLKTLVISMHNKYSTTKKCKSIGVLGYILKDDTDKDLLLALRTVSKGNKYYSSRVEEHFQNVQKSEQILSLREEQVLDLICDGLTTNQIAKQMFVGSETVKTHKRNIKIKLGISKTIDLIKYKLERENLMQ
ncbi:response regulator transcription factor [Flammeovirga sp. OC4]|uniref:response regulator n=1 Tax=Flammeovirga sp. OC4 TaxID=1382345 RepID=UPI0005C6241D|nr:response regulator transcription factor [Flammeovirga sp. OC4]